jgi:hypothetical protein
MQFILPSWRNEIRFFFQELLDVFAFAQPLWHTSNNNNNKFEKQRSDGHAKSHKGSSAARGTATGVEVHVRFGRHQQGRGVKFWSKDTRLNQLQSC